LNSIYFISSSSLNLNPQRGSYANIRDPVVSASTGDGIIILDKPAGAAVTDVGRFYLWGDNSGFSGTININAGSFYAMIEAEQTAAQKAADPLGQRKTFKLNNATVKFENGTTFHPMIYQDGSDKRLVPLDVNSSKLSVATDVKLVPYELSKLEPGTYTFNLSNDNYSKFKGWDNSLASLVINGSSVILTIKRDLAGYQGLAAVVDDIRRSDLSSDLNKRDLYDELYYTGEISTELVAGLPSLAPTVTKSPYPSVTATPRPTVTATPRPTISASPEPTPTLSPIPTSTPIPASTGWLKPICLLN
jgi:hypothetical protein